MVDALKAIRDFLVAQGALTALTGGRPYLLGSLVGAVIMQTLTVMLQMRGVITEHTLIIKAVVAIVVCLLQARALGPIWSRLGRRTARSA